MNELDQLLPRWADFFVSMSQAGAALIGLLFVVITVAADRRPNDIAKTRVYLTPTVIYLASVLCVAEMMTIPTQTRHSLMVCICLLGVLGLCYSGFLCFSSGGSKRYYSRLDLILYAVLPVAAYALLTLGGVTLLSDIQCGLTFVAASILSLLILAIRNSWAMAVDIVTTRPRA